MAFLPALAIVATVASTAIAAKSAANQAAAAKASAEYNATVSEQDAKRANEEAAIKAGETARLTRQNLAGSRAGAKTNGLALEGSIDDLLGQTERRGNLDALTAVYEGNVGGQTLRNRATLSRFEGSNAQRAGNAQAAGSVFSGAARSASLGYQYYGGS